MEPTLKRDTIKAGRRTVVELLLISLLVPQAFVFFYYFSFLFKGGNVLGLLETLSLYALTISWVSVPFLVLLTVLVRALVGARVRWFVTLPLCVGAGFLWLAAWNLLVYHVFSYGRAALPIFLCSLGTAGYAQARALYLDNLPPLKPSKEVNESGPAKSQAEDLSE